jgi:protein SCO1/2
LINRIKVIIAIFTLTGALLGCGTNRDWNATDISGLMPDLQFNLINDNGREVSEADYPGKVNVLYFGYTFCPDVCPTTLARIRLAIQQLADQQKAQVNVLFISVDPERDTPAHLKAYISSFGPEFSGLTGSQQQLKKMVRNYRVTYGYGKPDEDGNYDVSHSSAIFIFDKKGAARLLARDSVESEKLAADIAQLLSTGN